jgi:hypothetical protein
MDRIRIEGTAWFRRRRSPETSYGGEQYRASATNTPDLATKQTSKRKPRLLATLYTPAPRLSTSPSASPSRKALGRPGSPGATLKYCTCLREEKKRNGDTRSAIN